MGDTEQPEWIEQARRAGWVPPNNVIGDAPRSHDEELAAEDGDPSEGAGAAQQSCPAATSDDADASEEASGSEEVPDGDTAALHADADVAQAETASQAQAEEPSQAQAAKSPSPATAAEAESTGDGHVADWQQQALQAGWIPQSPPPGGPPPTGQWQATPPPAAPEPAWVAQARQAGWVQQQTPGPGVGASSDGQSGKGVSRRGWIIGGGTAASLLIVGAAVAGLLLVAGSEEEPSLVPPPTLQRGAPTAKQPATTVIIRETGSKSSSSKSRASSGTSSSSESSGSGSAPAASASGPAAKIAVERALNQHFNEIVQGQYAAAYSNLTGSATGSSQDSWIQAQREDGLYDFDLDVAVDVSGDSATATILRFVTRAEASGCHTWSGSWSMAKVGGSWKIAKSNLSRGDC